MLAYITIYLNTDTTYVDILGLEGIVCNNVR